MDQKCTGIVIKTEDYREADKLVRLFSPEKGVISVVFKGVKKAGAKLRNYAQVFAFCEFELAENAGRYTVKTCQQKENLFALVHDPDRFAAACVVIETAEKTGVAVESAGLFLMILKSLKTLIYSDAPPPLVAAKFIQKVLSLSGFYKSPAKREPQDGSVRGVLYHISRLTVDGLAEFAVAPAAALDALFDVADAFARTFGCEILALSYYKKTLSPSQNP